tara:strand:- start:2391 stop:2759 length:369 start_codon:yes stop_codon:yes gene_type:complete
MGLNLLIVEDLPEFSEWFKLVLLQRYPGTQAQTAINLWEAEQLMSRNRPDLILLDEIVDSQKTWEFAKNCIGEGYRVIFMTGMENFESIHQELNIPRLPKPLDEKDPEIWKLWDDQIKETKS